MQHITDKNAPVISGYIMLVVMAIITIFTYKTQMFLSALSLVFYIPLLSGFRVLQPNEARVLTFLGKYIGTIKDSGFVFSVPFTNSTSVSTRYINFNTGTLKVNDLRGNPIEIGAVVVWRVHSAAQAVLNVNNYDQFIANQSEIAVRGIAARYPYDDETLPSLRGNTQNISEELVAFLQEKLDIAGIEVKEVRLSNLAYSAEIASAMLRKQQAQAVVEARGMILQNAVSLADGVIAHLNAQLKSPMTDDVKINLMSNLLVVLVSDKDSSPVLNVGR